MRSGTFEEETPYALQSSGSSSERKALLKAIIVDEKTTPPFTGGSNGGVEILIQSKFMSIPKMLKMKCSNDSQNSDAFLDAFASP
ncbi:MAG TPA: hypothetical protein VHC44_04000 [Verrucomicrobiae bacterium]|nr:hypothetical protein [Verrucomicrobiae bacterium]